MDNAEQQIFLKDHPDLKIKMLNWASRFNIFCFLDNNGYHFESPAFECLLAAGSRRSFSFPRENALKEFAAFFDAQPAMLFGHLGYNAAGNAYNASFEEDNKFGRGFFFEAETVLRLENGALRVVASESPATEILRQVLAAASTADDASGFAPDVQPCITKQEYLDSIAALKKHLARGDCYEANFCRQFFCDDALISPVALYQRLCAASPAPFAALYRLNDHYCFCASPERFLKKTGNLLISQPIKGTAKRDPTDEESDNARKAALPAGAKERAENIMITDLVRNDLSIVARKGSVRVKELCGVYSFPQVHHLISTIEATLDPQRHFAEAIEACYPMGSMTGAPKKRVMEIIAAAEKFDRGLFSGSIGYITPAGDFDLNVVIRSIFYDANKKRISLCAGSAITFLSDPEAEYEECTAKASGLIAALQTVSIAH